MKVFYFLLLFLIISHQTLGQQHCEKDFFKTSYLNAGKEINVLLIWFPINIGAQSTLRICSEKTGLPLQRHCGYDRSNKAGKWEEINNDVKLINCTLIPNLCLEEPFEHNYIRPSTTTKSLFLKFSNMWETTKMKERGVLKEPCLQASGVPFTRLCEYNRMMHKAQWELLSPDMRNISCYRDEQSISYNLTTLHQKVQKDNAEDKVEAKQVADNLTDLLIASQNRRIPADIKISTEILKIITEDEKSPDLINEVLNVTDIVMAENEDTIKKSEEINATSSFLRVIDNYLYKMAQVLVPTNQCQNKKDGIDIKTVNHTSLFYVNPTCSNITGVAIYKKRIYKEQQFDNNTGYYYSFLYMNRTLDYIINEPDLLLASFFPLSLWNNMKTYLGSVNNETVLTFILFKNDKLFVNHTRMDYRPKENILEIKISNYTGVLPEDIPFVYGYPRDSHMPSCGYWNYSTWIKAGISTTYKNVSNYQYLICRSTHLTHLGAIFDLSFTDLIMLDISHNDMLEYISILGCGLSLLGLSCIWLTAICFKSYRVNPSNKVLLNMSFVLTLLMLFFILANLPKDWNVLFNNESVLGCKITGAFLHYIVMVLFFWMLIIAVMQYKRYVKVVGYVMPTNYVLKCAIFSWGLPLVPVCSVAYMDGYAYQQNLTDNGTGICYPTGDSLIYAVILPTSIVMLANLCIFVYIFFSLHRSLSQFDHHAKKRIKTQVRIAVLLFFLLGISWLFGLFSRLEKSPVFSYLFCLTSTLQGFILFVYSIIIDEQTRLAWVVCLYAKSYDTKEGKCKTKYMNMVSRQTNLNK